MNRLIVFILAAILAGCESLPSQAPVETDPAVESRWQAHQQRLAALESWTLHGRMVLVAGDDGWTATIHWDQERQHYNLRFIAPLGQGTYELEGDTDSVTLLTADNRLLHAASPEALLQENLGWQIPVASLKYWVRGIPDPALSPGRLVLDDSGRLSRLQQSGWRISILRYREDRGLALPEKLFLKNRHFQLRLVIQDWQTTI